MWCFEHFEMEHGPDIVTFAKKMFSGGIYHNKEHRPRQAARIMNTWCRCYKTFLSVIYGFS
jgi:4-aminobutyrate aminotransferase/(S)-3-amino-2-methylpropionate transaminase